MKFSHTSLTLILIAGPPLFACSDQTQERASDVANEIGESWDAIKLYTIERSADFRDRVSEGMRELDRQIEDLADRSGDAWDATRADLASKREALAEQLDDLGDATADTWESARDKTVALYEDLRDSVKRALDQPEE